MPRKKTNYTDRELNAFKDIILRKLDEAKKELKYLQEQISHSGDNGTDDTVSKFKGVEDGAGSSEREYMSQMASRQITFIQHLENALVRIENKSYGICRETGKLISKQRLKAVPHATLSIEAKMAQK